MGETTAIAWTDHTFNPWWGCERVSPGCQHCYAETFAKRTGNLVWGKNSDRRRFGDKHWAAPERWQRLAEQDGQRHLVFCASMADVFEYRADHHDDRLRLWALIEATPNLTWQLLTKRPENVRDMVPVPWLLRDPGWPKHVWIGTTVEDQQRADERLPHLVDIPAPVRFLSCEPLLGPVDLGPWLFATCSRCNGSASLPVPGGGTTCPDCLDGIQGTRPLIDWVIAGGESGAGHRALDLDHARRLRDDCRAAGVPFFFKQVGGHTPTAGGDQLDGRTWKQLPSEVRR